MLVARLEHKRSQFREGEFSDLEKFLFLQVSDELWKDHIAGLQDALPSTQMSAQSRGGALVEYMRRGFEAYGHFREGVIDTFLPRLVRFPASRLPAGLRAEVALPEDISRILV
jgi:preprotein translocase subunit SecA